MPKRKTKPERSWTSRFVREWIRLAGGEAGIDELYDRAGDLEFKNSHRDPLKVAAKDYAEAIRPRRDLIPGFNAP